MTKHEIISHVEKLLDLKKEKLENQMHSLKTDLLGETKSSMGDKYETSRAQLHLEMEKLNHQLFQLENQIQHFKNIDFEKPFQSANIGALISTEKAQFLISIGLGGLSISALPIYCISLNSPLGKNIENKQVGDLILLGGNEQMIQKIE